MRIRDWSSDVCSSDLAVVALLARGAGETAIRLQALIYPVVDYRLAGGSYERYAEGYGVLTRGAMQWFQRHYLHSAGDAGDWRASPIKAASHRALPPAVIVSAECDVLCDEGGRYAEALRAAGVAVDHKPYAGQIGRASCRERVCQYV